MEVSGLVQGSVAETPTEISMTVRALEEVGREWCRRIKWVTSQNM